MRHRGRHLAVVILMATLAFGGCASFEERFQAVENRTAALEAQIADLQASQQDIVSRLVRMRQELDSSLQPMRTQQADRGEDMRGLQTQIGALEDRLTTVTQRLTSLTEQMSTTAAGGGSHRSGAAGVPIPAPRSGATVSPGAGTPTQGRPASAADTLYRTAYTDYLKENYDLAISGFREYIVRYPGSERADNAKYWIGESQFAMADYAGARDTFGELTREYGDGDMVPDAILRGAFARVELGQSAVAIQELRRLIGQFPGTEQAGLACFQLSRLGAELPAACPRQ